MKRKVGDIVKLVSQESTRGEEHSLIIDGVSYTEDSEFRIVEIDEDDIVSDSQPYLVTGLNGENDAFDEIWEEFDVSTGFFVCEKHIVK